MNDIIEKTADTDFPHAPAGWSVVEAKKISEELGITMGPEHWETVLCLQEYFDRNEVPNRRELNDALEEFWHLHGGLKGLYLLFPGGPVTQGCAIAGINIPAGSIDKSFGSVV